MLRYLLLCLGFLPILSFADSFDVDGVDCRQANTFSIPGYFGVAPATMRGEEKIVGTFFNQDTGKIKIRERYASLDEMRAALTKLYCGKKIVGKLHFESDLKLMVELTKDNGEPVVTSGPAHRFFVSENGEFTTNVLVASIVRGRGPTYVRIECPR